VIVNLSQAINPVKYISSLGLMPFKWQQRALDSTIRRLIILTARQSGKSTIVGGKSLHKAKFYPGSLILIVSPSQDQSKELMKKIEEFIQKDSELHDLRYNSTFEKQLENGSRIVALPGSERSVRGYSGPRMIIIDEASRVLDSTYAACRPMMVGANTELILMSTPYGKKGFFFKEWTKGEGWTKIEVNISYRIDNDILVPNFPEEQFRKERAARGIHGFYSPRHTREELEQELASIPFVWFDQEYCCDFVDPEGTLFTYETLLAAQSDDIKPFFRKTVVDSDIKPFFGGT
jgi:hypothetical protein